MASNYMFAGVLCLVVVLVACGKLPHGGGEQYGGQQGGGDAVGASGGQGGNYGGGSGNYGGAQSRGAAQGRQGGQGGQAEQGGPYRSELFTGPDVYGYDSTFPGGKAIFKSFRGEGRAKSGGQGNQGGYGQGSQGGQDGYSQGGQSGYGQTQTGARQGGNAPKAYGGGHSQQ